MDNYALVKGAKNKENAYLFIDYLLRDEVCEKIIDDLELVEFSINAKDSFIDSKSRLLAYVKRIKESKLLSE